MGKTTKLTKEIVMKRFNEIHNNFYDYSLFDNYINNKQKIKIICPIHGEFEQRVSSHLTHGCKKCTFDKLKLSKEQLLLKFNKYHKNKYEYNMNTFIDMNTEIEINCPFHGIFYQKPINHINRGCKKCKNDKIGNIKRKNKYQVIKDFNTIHNNKYDYSLMIYKNNKTKIKIICPFHGEFLQRPDDHLRGIGCPQCNDSYGIIKIKYILNNLNINYINEKTFEDCKYKRKLSFDLYLPNYNIIIEYDGIQHYHPIEYFGGLNGLKQTQKRDQIKNEYCLNNNIRLIRIKYDEDIEEKLKSILTL